MRGIGTQGVLEREKNGVSTSDGMQSQPKPPNAISSQLTRQKWKIGNTRGQEGGGGGAKDGGRFGEGKMKGKNKPWRLNVA